MTPVAGSGTPIHILNQSLEGGVNLVGQTSVLQTRKVCAKSLIDSHLHSPLLSVSKVLYLMRSLVNPLLRTTSRKPFSALHHLNLWSTELAWVGFPSQNNDCAISLVKSHVQMRQSLEVTLFRHAHFARSQAQANRHRTPSIQLSCRAKGVA